jgi:hypothetical protein
MSRSRPNEQLVFGGLDPEALRRATGLADVNGRAPMWVVGHICNE